MIRRQQLTLVRRVRDWQVAVVEKYRDVRGHRRVLTSLEPSCPRSEKDTERYWDYSCHSSFGTLTLTLPTASNPPFSGDINPPRSSSLSSRVVAVLGAIRPSYNVIASEAGSLTTREAWGAFTTNLVSDGQQEVSLDKDGISARTLWTPWTPGLPTWGSQIGWLGRVILLCAGLSGWCAVLFGAVRAMSRKLFLLDSGPLCGTRRSYVDGTDPAFDNALSTLEGSMGGSSSRAAAELVREECSAWPQLRAIAVGLVADLRAAPDGSETTPERLLEEIAARGESVYRALWSACTCAEKLVLVQLADEGIVNPGTRPVIHRLMGRDLVAQDPHPRVMTQGFSAFVRAALPRQTVGKWEQVDQAIPWQTIISTTVVAALAFLFVAQRDVASAWMAYLTGASATLPALFKLVGGLKFPSDSPEA
jgi:hypothetical protein